MRFVDTNVLLYTLEPDSPKRSIAESILLAGEVAVSTQVLGEFYVQATRPTRAYRLTHEQAASVVHTLSGFPVQELTLAIVTSAMATVGQFGISYWDAAILEAARALGCDTVLSEDMQHGQDYGGVLVRNPFL